MYFSNGLGEALYDLLIVRQERTAAWLKFDKYSLLVLARGWYEQKEKVAICSA